MNLRQAPKSFSGEPARPLWTRFPPACDGDCFRLVGHPHLHNTARSRLPSGPWGCTSQAAPPVSLCHCLSRLCPQNPQIISLVAFHLPLPREDALPEPQVFPGPVFTMDLANGRPGVRAGREESHGRSSPAPPRLGCGGSGYVLSEDSSPTRWPSPSPTCGFSSCVATLRPVPSLLWTSSPRGNGCC